MANIRLALFFFFSLIISSFLVFCSGDSHRSPDEDVFFQSPEWAVNANIYKVNIRQYSEVGTFKAFTEDLQRLKEMGVNILWLMPVHPIGEENRKGTLGNLYSVKDYTEVNPEFGNKADFRGLIEEAQSLRMRVIMDWPAGYTSSDAVWTETNPGFYATDDEGNYLSSGDDRQDVIQLDTENRELWNAMIEAMEYWVSEYNIDGFHAAGARMMPVQFWISAREQLETIKPLFMLADDEDPELHRAFDMTYGLDYSQTIKNIAAGQSSLSDLDAVMDQYLENFHKRDFRMLYTTNHDVNSLQESDPDLYGENIKNFAVLSASLWGMPLIYNGQESGLHQQLEMFEKDPIEWKDYKYQEFYSTLLDLNTRNQALFNGEIGGDYRKMPTDKDEYIFAFKRIGHHEQVLVILNFSDSEQTFTFVDGHEGTWNDVYDGSEKEIKSTNTLGRNSFLLLERVYMSH
jgi:glycosidase